MPIYAKDASGRSGLNKAKVNKKAIERNIKSRGGDDFDIMDVLTINDGRRSVANRERKTGIMRSDSKIKNATLSPMPKKGTTKKGATRRQPRSYNP